MFLSRSILKMLGFFVKFVTYIDNVMFDLIGIIFLFIGNISPQQFSLHITRALSIEFVELLHYLMYKTYRFRFSVRVYCNRLQMTP